MSSVGYVHSDLIVTVGNVTDGSATYLPRVQSFSVQKDTPTNAVYEMGRATSVGPGAAGGEQYSASLSWMPINTAIEDALTEEVDAITALEVAAFDPLNTGVGGTEDMIIDDGYFGLTGPNIVSLEYTFEERADARATAQLRGSNRITSSFPAKEATPAIGSVATYKYGDIAVTVNAVSTVRCLRAVVRVAFTVEEAYQLGTATPVGTRIYRPVVTADLSFIRSTATAGNSALTEASPGDIVVNIGSSTIIHTLANMYTTSIGEGGQINGFATQQISYLSKGDATTGGWQVT